tara:strand:- start:26912 stop:27286 length:375 start_codon:yes stop_codon:yes gene_type:complete
MRESFNIPNPDDKSEKLSGMTCEVIDDGNAVQVDTEDWRFIYYRDPSDQTVKLRSFANLVKQVGPAEIPDQLQANALMAATDIFTEGADSLYLKTNDGDILPPEEAKQEIAKIKAMLERPDVLH